MLLLVATSLLSTVSVGTPRWQITLYMILMGLGIGTSFPVTSMSALHNVSFEFRGVVTSLVSFFRSIGSAVGVTVLGAVQASALTSRLATSGGADAQTPADPRALLSPEFQAHIPKAVLEKLITGLADSIAFVFQVTIVMAVIAFVFVLLMGRAKLEVSASRGPRREGGQHGGAPSPAPQQGH
ncbi:hypothetical protein LJK88_10255 [Paenibacillus sp. P26]|nr:hypothetical protein LJK88_10255 [Paenibacillus sp. P26]UUZ89784.1 hypothetical protein LJK87_27405 [Paenibacillus sp. P25]